MGRRRATALLLVSGAVVIALLVVFAIELSNSQADSKASVEARVHERALLAGDLVDSLFTTVKQGTPANSPVFGGRTVSVAALDKAVANNAYLAVMGPRGDVIRKHARIHEPGPCGAAAVGSRQARSGR